MSEANSPRILAVDDEEQWQGIFGRSLTRAGLDHEVVGDTDTAVARLATGEFTGVMTDGLEGNWRRVVEAANAVGARAVLFSGSFRVVGAAEEEGIAAFNKATLEPETMEEIIQGFMPEAQE